MLLVGCSKQDSDTLGETSNETQIVTFTDKNLETVIMRTLDKSLGEDITSIELSKLKKLSINNSGVTDLTGLESCLNLEELSLRGNSIRDISTLAGLTNPRHLNLSLNHISDISVLVGLTNLETLDLWNNNIVDISPLMWNDGLSAGDTVNLSANPLGVMALDVHIGMLEGKGIDVEWW
jgi:internalin A